MYYTKDKKNKWYVVSCYNYFEPDPKYYYKDVYDKKRATKECQVYIDSLIDKQTKIEYYKS